MTLDQLQKAILLSIKGLYMKKPNTLANYVDIRLLLAELKRVVHEGTLATDVDIRLLQRHILLIIKMLYMKE